MAPEEEDAPGPETLIARMNGGKSAARFQKDQIVYSQGDPADCVFYVRSGKLKVGVVSNGGKEAVVAILQPGSFCGEECLTGHDLRLSTVKALTECVLLRMVRGSIKMALQGDRQFARLFMTYLLERNMRIQENLVDQLLNSTEKRLARLLLILAGHGQEQQLEPIVPKINQEMLAEMIGSSRTHVNFFMNKFRQRGFIEYDGDIKVNRSLLTLLLQQQPRIASQD